MSKGHGDRDGKEDDLVAQLHAPLCSSGGPRFRKLMRIRNQSPDTVSSVNAGNGEFDVGDCDQVIFFGYAGDETGNTKLGSLMMWLDASGFDVETAETRT